MYWGLFFLTTIICIPGIFYMLHSEKKILSDRENEDIPLFARILTHIITVVLFTFAGSYFALKVNLVDPFITSFLEGHFDTDAMLHTLKIGLTYGLVCSIGNMLFYYLIFKRLIDKETYQKVENHYRQLGIGTRVFYGGFIEEIIFRWGIMGFIIWVGSFLFQYENSVLIWVAILISGLLFALTHIPGLSSIGLKKTPAIMGYVLFGNMWVGILCGHAFLKGGILASILVHILFHLLWYPVQIATSNNK
ncbi:CPBP family intramembrane glutamic endopeptidase [Fredinandcohnia humi]